jgi:acetate---CoA ligase (ADP-forming)
VIAVRADLVADVMAECIAAKARSAVVISGGFREVGRQDLQDRIVAIAKEAAFPFIGPNCLGIYVPSHVDTFFLPGERMVKPAVGNVSFVSQSGGILVDQMIKFTNEGVGLAKSISIGNKALLGELEILDYLAEDTATQVMAFYIEGFGANEGRVFVLKAGRCGKPVVVLKSGKSPGGGRAVSSHTASLAGDYASFSAVLSQYGIVEAANELELVSFCESLSKYTKSIAGRVGIVTVSGGHGAIAVDACTAHGIAVPELPENIREELRKTLSPSVQGIATLNNPVDLTGSGVDDDFVAAANIFFAREEIDCVLALLLPYVPGITADIGAKLSSVARQRGKPLIAYVPHVEKYAMLIEGFDLNGSPVAPSIEGAVLMVDALRRNRP